MAVRATMVMARRAMLSAMCMVMAKERGKVRKKKKKNKKTMAYDDVRRTRYIAMIAKRKREMKDFTYKDHDQLGTRKTLLTKR